MSNGSSMIIHLIVRLINKIWLNEMSYSSELYSYSER